MASIPYALERLQGMRHTTRGRMVFQPQAHHATAHTKGRFFRYPDPRATRGSTRGESALRSSARDAGIPQRTYHTASTRRFPRANQTLHRQRTEGSLVEMLQRQL